ncbi:DUF2867 domain-containing protein [Parvibaculum lavamentivorans]|nr:DUF2867 domain-containing protein [Rhodobiaceae bacterium]MBN4051834.1 DUF2867 domain-containing protein [Parvibaculum lavamentivorans]
MDEILTRYKSVLPDADFADEYFIDVPGSSINAVSTAERVMGRQPAWVSGLMKLRGIIVTPLGLQHRHMDTRDTIGNFPVISKSSQRVVVGLDDKHLDFRLVLECVPSGENTTKISATTLVQTHNFLGRAYLQTILPFHKIIVPQMLAQARNRAD